MRVQTRHHLTETQGGADTEPPINPHRGLYLMATPAQHHKGCTVALSTFVWILPVPLTKGLKVISVCENKVCQKNTDFFSVQKLQHNGLGFFTVHICQERR